MGILVFTNLADAIREGYQVFDRVSNGYLVRRRLPAGWGIAVVVLQPQAV